MLLPVRRALLSVSDKTGLVELARQLAGRNIELLSTGGTARLLADAARTGEDFHSLVIDGQIAAWGFSRILDAEGDNFGIEKLTLEAGAALLHDFEALPGRSGDLLNLIQRVSSDRLTEGAKRVRIQALNPGRALVNALREAGFRKRFRIKSIEILRWQRKRVITA